MTGARVMQQLARAQRAYDFAEPPGECDHVWRTRHGHGESFTSCIRCGIESGEYEEDDE